MDNRDCLYSCWLRGIDKLIYAREEFVAMTAGELFVKEVGKILKDHEDARQFESTTGIPGFWSDIIWEGLTEYSEEAGGPEKVTNMLTVTTSSDDPFLREQWNNIKLGLYKYLKNEKKFKVEREPRQDMDNLKEESFLLRRKKKGFEYSFEDQYDEARYMKTDGKIIIETIGLKFVRSGKIIVRSFYRADSILLTKDVAKGLLKRVKNTFGKVLDVIEENKRKN